MNYQILQTIIAGVFGGGVIGFVEFLIRRKDEKNNKNDEVLKAIDELNKKVDERFNTLDKKIDSVDRKGDERDAIASRVRILGFTDEMRTGQKHSKDSWDQVITDADKYEKYCDKNKDNFKNGIAESAITLIRKGYFDRLDSNDFL